VAASSGQGDDDPLAEAKAYNLSIYLMLAMPYGLLGGLGWFVYRGLKANKQALEQSSPALSDPGE
jgi:hypothetical protein